MIGAIYHVRNSNLCKSINRRTSLRGLFNQSAGGKTKSLRKKYSSVLTSFAIIDEIKSQFASKDEFLQECQNRSVFTDDELNYFWKTQGKRNMVLKFVFVKSLTKKVILGDLWDMGITQAPSGPRPFTRLNDAQFDSIIRKSEIDLQGYWRA